MLRRLALAVLLGTVGLATPARAQLDRLPDLSGLGAHLAEAPPPGAGPFRSGLDVPTVEPGATAARVAREIVAPLAEASGAYGALDEIVDGMPLAVAALEQQLEGLGFGRRDLGVAAAYALITLWETARAETIPQDLSIVAGRALAAATAAHGADGYRDLSAREQEAVYETLVAAPMMLEAFAQQFSDLGREEPSDDMRSQAADAFEALFGVPPAAVTVDADGRISGLARPGAERPTVASSTSWPEAPPRTAGAAPRAGGAVASSLPAASANGAEIYMKYTWGYGLNGMWNRQEPLVLFPDVTAFEGIPRGGVREFSPAGIRAAFEDAEDLRRASGTWRRAGDRITLTIDGESRVLRKTPRGWWDDEDEIDNETGYDTYFPVVLATREHMLGPWETSSLFVTGSFGGAAPQVASGSSTDRVFYADGTFSEDSDRFVSATTANMGDAYGAGGDVSVFSQNEGHAAGRWRIDGPLMTIEKDGDRRIVLAFIMPEWSQDNPDSDTWVDDDFWERPDADD